MEQEELENLTECWSCGASIAATADAAYQFSEEGFLCFECAFARGGIYLADEDRWEVPPAVVDLPDERRPHA